MPVSSKKFLDIQATIGCGLILKHVRDMIRTYSQDILYYRVKSVKQMFLSGIFDKYFEKKTFSNSSYLKTGKHWFVSQINANT